jgi:hypothetical protein
MFSALDPSPATYSWSALSQEELMDVPAALAAPASPATRKSPVLAAFGMRAEASGQAVRGKIRLLPEALMELQARADNVIDVSDRDQGQPAEPAVDRQQVHLVERDVDEAREAAFDCKLAPDEAAHQAADG